MTRRSTRESRRDLEVGHAISLFSTGRVLQARELLRRLRPQLPLTGHSDELALVGLGVVEVHSGVDLAQIEREMAHTLTEAVRLGDHAAAGVAAMVVGTVANHRRALPRTRHGGFPRRSSSTNSRTHSACW